MNYYNEWDKYAAQWLRELIKMKLIPNGYVDERSITDVTASDLEGFTQCHFFAGIGGWSQALKLAGVASTAKLWTGSPPCQPFSIAGKQQGQLDERHLAPTFLRLVSQCKPPILFGEQVAPAIAKSWMCDLQTHLEGEGYAVGFTVLPACSVGAPHKRDRLFFGAHQLADTNGRGRRERGESGSMDAVPQRGSNNLLQTEKRDTHGSMAYTDSERLQRQRGDSNTQGREGQDIRQAGLLDGAGAENNTTCSYHGFWSDADWLGCRDGKFRPVEPGTFPLANGIPARVGRLRGYGNAIVPQVASEFIKAFIGE